MVIQAQVLRKLIYDWDMIVNTFITDEGHQDLGFETIKFNSQSSLRGHTN